MSNSSKPIPQHVDTTTSEVYAVPAFFANQAVVAIIDGQGNFRLTFGEFIGGSQQTRANSAVVMPLSVAESLAHLILDASAKLNVQILQTVPSASPN